MVGGSCLMVSEQQLEDWVDNYIQIQVETVKAIREKTGTRSRCSASFVYAGLIAIIFKYAHAA
jgi:hypothetical protein